MLWWGINIVNLGKPYLSHLVQVKLLKATISGEEGGGGERERTLTQEQEQTGLYWASVKTPSVGALPGERHLCLLLQ
jgi:hypothetical protein